MELSSDFQLSSGVLLIEATEKTLAWLKEVCASYERKESSFAAKCFAEDAKVIIPSVGTIKGLSNIINRFVAREYSASEGGRMKSPKDQFSMVLDGGFTYPSGAGERLSWNVTLSKNIDNDKLTSVLCTDSGAVPDIFSVWRKKLSLPSFAVALQ
ncbi:hypothetical protein BKA70DRAFT_1508148 [Coprinopsis sp. MPI-PUGE-AT-0042]|nr:hypothetical protein BKA70DRAFT_1508148 [Coprinopsis sp. MPI-PUGE-AT-0042]